MIWLEALVAAAMGAAALSFVHLAVHRAAHCWCCCCAARCVAPAGFWSPGCSHPLGVALLTFGLVGLLEGHWAVDDAGGLPGAAALIAGAAVARGADVVSGAVDDHGDRKVSGDRLSQPRLDPHLPGV